LLISTRFANVSQIHRVAMPFGFREQLTFGQEPAFGARWNPDPAREQFVFSSDQGGGEFFQLYLYDARTEAVRRITDGKSRNEDPVWSRDGRWIAFDSTARNGKDTDIWIAPAVLSAPPHLAFQVDGAWQPDDWSPDGSHLLLSHFVSVRDESLWNLDVQTGQAEPVAEGRGVATAARWDVTGQGFFYLTDQASEFRQLAFYDVATHHSTVLSQVNWDVDEYDVSHDDHNLAFESNEDGVSHVHLLERTGPGGPYVEMPAPVLRPGVVRHLKFHPRLAELAFTLSNAHQSADTYSYRIADRRLTRWTSSETGGLNPARFVEPKLIHYPAFDQRPVPAFVYLPPRDRFTPPYPVLINIHGGPESQFRPGFMGRLNYLVNGLGIALVAPNVRGSTGYGKTWVDLDNGKLRSGAVQDIGSLLDWIATQPELDAHRVAVAGGSYGGFMSLATMVSYSDRLRCGIDLVGISNFLTFLQHTQDYRKDLRRVEYGDERDPDMARFLQEISPLTHADRIMKPLLVAQGANDPRVPQTEAQQIVSAVRANGQPVWYMVAEDEGHGFQKRINQDYFQDAEVLFLQTYLLPQQ
jgi:dipeptidyl aminopeptidase/acylaminoacyl peptidase